MGDRNSNTLMTEFQIIQNKAAKVMLELPPRSSSTGALKRLDVKPLSTRRFFPPFSTSIHKCLIGSTDFDFNLNRNHAVHSHNTRRSNDLGLH